MNIDDKSKFGELFEESIKESNSSLNHLIEEKRNIDVLKPIYLQQFLNDFKESIKYSKHSQYITSSLISTEGTEINPQ